MGFLFPVWGSFSGVGYWGVTIVAAAAATKIREATLMKISLK